MEKIEQLLASKLQSVVSIPSEEWCHFRTMLVHERIRKQEHYVRAGEEADSVGFVASGLFRLYYSTKEGDEYNKSFCGQGDWIASYSSLLLREPSFFSIQALSDGELLTFRYRDYQTLYDRHPCWERLGRIIAERMFIQKEKRERELLLLPAEARYRLFSEQFGHVAEQIPQYHIASYLGITPVALSRIRRRLT
ncbi:Crp/Fnr family transcriptional regulator [Paenibacillus kobensis]|uniref:Crp/Fnr family transcriptional regulator n=1 Tax=Paenibacillus kobensis TaxID=59841 RepID=UPI0013E371F8|nr:Crp/Fnr family transcriptional regulator [Paenibacillus kobensis]